MLFVEQVPSVCEHNPGKTQARSGRTACVLNTSHEGYPELHSGPDGRLSEGTETIQPHSRGRGPVSGEHTGKWI